MKVILARGVSVTLLIIVALLVLFAILINTLRFTGPLNESLTAEVEYQVSQIVGRDVDIGSLNFDLNGFTLIAHLTELTIYRHDGFTPALEFDEMEITLDAVKTLSNMQFVPTRIVLKGSSVEILRTNGGQLKLSGFDVKNSLNQSPRAPQADEQENLLDIFNDLTFAAQDINVYWNDQPLGLTYQFIARNLNIKMQQDSMSMRGIVALPEALGTDVDIAANIIGNIENYQQWDGKFYINTADIIMPNLPYAQFIELPVVLTSGLVDIEAWGGWDAGDLSLSGNIGIDEAVLVEKSESNKKSYYAARINSFTSRLNLKKTAKQWTLDADQVDAIVMGEPSQLSSLSLKLDENTQTLTGSIDHIEVSTLTNIAKVVSTSASFNSYLDEAKPEGDLTDLYIQYNPGRGEAATFMAESGVSQLGLQANRRFPGFNNLSGKVNVTHLGGSAMIHSQALSFNYPKYFDNRFDAHSVSATIDWDNKPGYADMVIRQLSLSTDEGEASGFGVLRINPGSHGFMDIEVQSDGLNLANISQYLPKNLPTKASQWLHSAFSGGSAEDITFTYRGEVARTAYRNGDAEIEAALTVKDLDIHYRDNWPDITAVTGELAFSGRGFNATLTQGSTSKHTLVGATVRIDDFYNPVLALDLKSKGPLSGGLDYLSNSPPGKKVRSFLKTVKVDGNATVNINTTIPLAKRLARKKTFKGDILFASNTLALPANNLSFETVSGKVEFTDSKYMANDIHAHFRGKPVVIALHTNDDILQVDVEGDLSMKELLPKSELLNEIIKGPSLWKSTTRIPLRQAREDDPTIRLSLQSDLRSSRIDLPDPLKNRAGQAQQLSVQVESDKNVQFIQFQMDDHLYGQLEMIKKKDSLSLNRASFKLQPDPSPMPDSGILIEGTANTFDLGQWIRRYTQLPFSGSGEVQKINADVKINQFVFTSQMYSDTHFKIANTDSFWRVNFDGDDIKGFTRIPVKLDKNSVLDFEFSKLKLSSADRRRSTNNTITKQQPNSRPVNPSSIPSINADVEAFFWDDIKLGSLHINSTSNDVGQIINKLRLEGDSVDLDLSGNWYTSANGDDQTSVSYSLSGENIGQFFRDIDLTQSISETTGSITGENTWSGAPNRIDFPSLKGVINANLEDGKLATIKSGGANRFLSVINLDSLSKNLIRNFKNIQGEGFFFDTMNSQVEIVNGEVFVNTAFVDSPAAKLNIGGSTDIVAQLHNLSMDVTPKLSSSAPLAASLLAGPQTGAIIYLLDKLATSAGLDVNDSLSLPYQIKGDWKKPEVIELFTVDDRDREVPEK